MRGASLAAGWVISGALFASFASHHASAQRPFVERVDVSRVLIDARVVDEQGAVIPGLQAADFEVTIDGDPVAVESVEWIGDGDGTLESPTEGADVDRRPRADGRLIVVLVQKDLHAIRIVGLMAMLQLIDPLLQELTPADRVAVLSFDSHLKIWTDFTARVDRVRARLKEDVLVARPPAVAAAEGPSLLSRLNPASAKRARGIEDGLRMIGDALEPLPGAKSVVLLGYGFGRFNGASGGVTLMDGYDEAREALQRARAAVFSLNVTQANYNSLQAGLMSLSTATGGFYSSTYEFPKLAMSRVVRALEGYYVLFVDKPRAKPGVHRIEAKLIGRRGTVYARSGYVD